jgi:hypothetical protein
MGAFKIVGRHSATQSSWVRGKVGTQANKRVYTTREDFERYAPETAERYRNFCKYDVEFYEQIGSKWVRTFPEWFHNKDQQPDNT